MTDPADEEAPCLDDSSAESLDTATTSESRGIVAAAGHVADPADEVEAAWRNSNRKMDNMAARGDFNGFMNERATNVALILQMLTAANERAEAAERSERWLAERPDLGVSTVEERLAWARMASGREATDGRS